MQIHQETAWLFGIFILLCVCLGYLMNAVSDVRESLRKIEELLEEDREA